MDSFSLEIIQYIFQYLNPKELRICSLVCKEFNLASKYFKQSEKWEKMFNLESKDEYGYDIDLVRNYLKNGYRYISFNGKINFKVIRTDKNYNASAADKEFIKNSFEKILFDDGFFNIFKFEKIKNFLNEII